MSDEEQKLVPAKVVEVRAIELVDVHLEWMVGQSIVAFSFYEPNLWSMLLSGGGWISTQDPWRLLATDRMIVGSSEHGHSYGLPEPVDAVATAMAETAGAAIVEARIGEAAPDLFVRFANGIVLEILTTSMAYECWTVRDAAGICVVIRGSRTAGTWTDSASPT